MIQPMERIAREQWAPDGVYLNTASYGLPPKVGWDALQAALADWRGGRTSWEHWGEATERSRRPTSRRRSTRPRTSSPSAPCR